MDTEYNTPDLYAAAFLFARGVKLKRTERAPDSRRVFFVFDDGAGSTADVANNFALGQNDDVPAQRFANAIKNLKSLVHNAQ